MSGQSSWDIGAKDFFYEMNFRWERRVMRWRGRRFVIRKFLLSSWGLTVYRWGDGAAHTDTSGCWCEPTPHTEGDTTIWEHHDRSERT